MQLEGGLQPRDSEGLAERGLSRQALDASVGDGSVSRSRDGERELRHLHRPRRSQGRPSVPGLRHDLAVLQPLAPMAVVVRPWKRAMGVLEQQGWLRRRVRSAVRAVLERVPRGFPSADQRIRRVPDDRVSAGVLAGERRLRRYLHLQRRHARGRERAASGEGVSLGRPRRVLDRADVRERDQCTRCRRQPGLPVGQLHFRRCGAAAEQRRPAEPRDAASRAWIPGRAGADGRHVCTASASRTGPATTRSTGPSPART